MQKCENDAEKLIRKVTLKMIEKENGFYFNLEDAFLEALHFIVSHLRLKNLTMYTYKGEIKKKKKNEHQSIIKKKKMSEFFFSNDKDAFLESLHCTFSHLQHKKLATVSFYKTKSVKT